MLILFSQENPDLLAQYGDLFKIYHFYNFTEWETQRMLPSAFVIEGSDAQYTTSILSHIRRDKEAYAVLCFISGSVSSLDNSYVDGSLPQPLLLQEAISQTADLEKSFKNSENNVTHQERLIKFLWLRPNFVLQPYHEWQHPRFYRYPLLEALSHDKSDAFEWLQTLANSRVLEALTLLDRQRECAYCRASHLSFVDVCPNCQSIDIEMQASLHCFTCGCVDVQEKFIHSGTLVCPKCNTQLRHIGSDYDRPIENHGCRACNHSFVEGDVLARCAMCEKEMIPNDLVSNDIHSWRLSNRGRTIAIRGEFFDIGASFDQLNFISRELFVHDLNWSLILSQRYPDIYFSLFGIYFANLPELAEMIGHTKLLQMLESFTQRLRGMLRTPDLSTRTDENMLWLLLPHTDEQGLRGFQARIQNSLESIMKESDQKLDSRFIGVALPHEQSGQEDATLLLARLSGELM